MSTKFETDMTYEKVLTWRVKSLCFHIAYDYQTREDSSLWYWVTMQKVAWFFDHMIICYHVTKKKRYISITTSPMDHQIWQDSGLKATRLKVFKVILLKAIKFMCP